jgi:hypothetical protein
MRSLGYILLITSMAVLAITAAIGYMREAAFNSGYWKGRAAGWDSHRRMINIQKETEEVFDYEKN